MSPPIGSRSSSPIERKEETPESFCPRRDLNPLFAECVVEESKPPQNLQLDRPAFCFTPEVVNGRIDTDLEEAIITDNREKAFLLIATRKNSLKNPNNSFIQVVQKGWETEALLLAAETNYFSAHNVVFICIKKNYSEVVKVLLARNPSLYQKKNWFMEQMDMMEEKNHEIYDLFALNQIEEHYDSELEKMLNDLPDFEPPEKEETWKSSVVEKSNPLNEAIQYFNALNDPDAATHVLGMEKPIQNLEQLIQLASDLEWKQTLNALRMGIE